MSLMEDGGGSDVPISLNEEGGGCEVCGGSEIKPLEDLDEWVREMGGGWLGGGGGGRGVASRSIFQAS